MVYSHLNCYILLNMVKSTICSCFRYILYGKWLKTTFCVLPTCFTHQRKLRFATFLYHQDDILKFWRWLFLLKICTRYPKSIDWCDTNSCEINFCDTNFCKFSTNSQKLVPQKRFKIRDSQKLVSQKLMSHELMSH